MALQGLSEMAAQIYSSDFNMTVTVSGPPGSNFIETFSITTDNALLLQSRDVSELVSSMYSRTRMARTPLEP